MLATQLENKRTKNNSSKLTRRGFLKVLGTSAIGLSLPGTSRPAPKKVRPNILFIMVDDLGKEWIIVTDALTDFTDLLPTFAELGGARIPEDLKIDGVSIAPLLLGKVKDSPRGWIMALGHGAARLDEKGVRGRVDYTERVIRDKRYKVWVSEKRQISQLYDLRRDPFEENNLIASAKSEHLAAIRKFQEVVDSLPEKDNRPRYKPRRPNPWDKKLAAKG